jgi:hypothetical protein
MEAAAAAARSDEPSRFRWRGGQVEPPYNRTAASAITAYATAFNIA